MQDLLHQIKHFLELQQDTYGNIRFRPEDAVAAPTSNEQVAIRTQDVQDVVVEPQKSLSSKDEEGPNVPSLEKREKERDLVANPLDEKL